MRTKSSAWTARSSSTSWMRRAGKLDRTIWSTLASSTSGRTYSMLEALVFPKLDLGADVDADGEGEVLPAREIALVNELGGPQWQGVPRCARPG